MRIILTNVGHMANGRYNLFSVTRAMMDSWVLSRSKKEIVLKKGDTRICFDVVINTKKGALFCAYL